MGHLSATAMAAATDRRSALCWHLQHNHYPAIPLAMVPTCEQAIDLANVDEWNVRIELPAGFTYQGEPTAPVWAVVEQHHLDPFIDESDR